MNPAIFQLIEQGLSLLPVLVSAGISIEQRVEQLIALNKAAKDGTHISDTELAAIRAQFDADLAEFNKPMED